MPLTPIEIQQKGFGTALRGYSVDEVDDFLDEVVVALKGYEQSLREANGRVAELEANQNKESGSESAIVRALVAAQRSADATVAEAQAEGERLLEAVRREVTILESTQDDERTRLQSEISLMRERLRELRTSVKALVEAIDSDLEGLETNVERVGDEIGQPATVVDPIRATASEPSRDLPAEPVGLPSEDASPDEETDPEAEDVDSRKVDDPMSRYRALDFDVEGLRTPSRSGGGPETGDPQAERPEAERPQGERPQGERPQGDDQQPVRRPSEEGANRP